MACEHNTNTQNVIFEWWRNHRIFRLLGFVDDEEWKRRGFKKFVVIFLHFVIVFNDKLQEREYSTMRPGRGVSNNQLKLISN